MRDRALAVLRHGLVDDEFWPSIHAAEGLIRAGHGEEVVDMLEARLKTETDDQRRCGLARELFRAGDSSKVGILTEVLRQPLSYAHVHAAEGLYKIGQVGDRATMERAFRTSDNVILRLMAAAALARSGDDEALEFVRTVYADTTSDAGSVRISAWLLGRVGTDDDIQLLRRRLPEAPDSLTSAYVNHSLAALGDDQGLAELARNLDSVDPAIRTYAAAFALDAGAVSLTPRLITMMDDPYPDVRYRAATTLLVLSSGTDHTRQP